MAEDLSEVRNTLEKPRDVVPVRLSDSERRRISRAAQARDLPFSSYVRWAALEAASDQELRAKPKPVEPKRAPVVLDSVPQRPRRLIDGEWVDW
jgi:hypothetical protein